MSDFLTAALAMLEDRKIRLLFSAFLDNNLCKMYRTFCSLPTSINLFNEGACNVQDEAEKKAYTVFAHIAYILQVG